MTPVRGRVTLFWMAFVSMLLAAAAIVVAVRSFLDSLTPLFVSTGLSLTAIVLGICAVMLGRSTKS